MKRLLALFILTVCMLTGCDKITYVVEPKMATVTNKKYTPARSQPVMIGKMFTAIHHPPDYDIELTYGDITTLIDVDKDTYDMFEVGHEIPINLFTGYNADGRVVITKINLREVTE